MTGKLNVAWSSTVMKRKINQSSKKYICSVNTSNVSRTSRVKHNLMVYNKFAKTRVH